jgi:hypothetical protein
MPFYRHQSQECSEHAACRSRHDRQADETDKKGPTLRFELIKQNAIGKLPAKARLSREMQISLA